MSAVASTSHPPDPVTLAPFPLLAGDPEFYRPGTFDLDGLGVRAWINVFRRSIPSFARHVEGDAQLAGLGRDASAAAARTFAHRYGAALDRILDPTTRSEPVPGLEACPAAEAASWHQRRPGANPAAGACIIRLCRLRETLLRDLGYPDVFRATKEAENAAATRVLPALVAELDAGRLDDQADGLGAGGQGTPTRFAALLRGCLAGNIFDLGAATTAEMAAAEAAEGKGGDASVALFHKARAGLLPRPWAAGCDDVNAAACALSAGRPDSSVLVFVDNAGADTILGVVPLARELLREGDGGVRAGAVVLLANDAPSINDVTFDELQSLLGRPGAPGPLALADPILGAAIAQGRLRAAPSGNDLCVLDLACVGPAARAEAILAGTRRVAARGGREKRDDCSVVRAFFATKTRGGVPLPPWRRPLVVLIGMGRGIEPHLHARLVCDSLRPGMVKHPEVAASLGGREGSSEPCRMLDGVVRFLPGEGIQGSRQVE